MENYFRYFPGQATRGPRLSACGFTCIAGGTAYPPIGHPVGRAFDWEHGRILRQWQIVAITEGRGEFEAEGHGLHRVAAGHWFVLEPGRRHRYRPASSDGWTEHWLEIEGTVQPPSPEAGPLLDVGEASELIALFVRLHALARAVARPEVLDSLAVHLFHSAFFSARRREESPARVLVQSAQRLFLESLGDDLAVGAVAQKLGVHPATLRRAFHHLVGTSPKRYFDELRLYRARDLVSDGRLTLAAIAEDLGFDSAYHLSARFKQRYGVSPARWRNAQR